MSGMPRRGTPTTYPAPPFERTESGLMGPRPFMPVPWSREIFSSSVICLRTRAARSSGERAGFIQGRVEEFCEDWAKAGCVAVKRMASENVTKLIRRGRARVMVSGRSSLDLGDLGSGDHHICFCGKVK